jgi:BirA family biotin operon repressor/biotin-[acetyl-CoA-carboxylase] ligase
MNRTQAVILRLLRQGSHSPSELSNALQIPMGEIHAQVDRLREKGMDIALHPLLGFGLRSQPERLIADDILSRMDDGWSGIIETLSTTPSTNSLALEYGLQGKTGPVAIFAETQTAGRGRFGRVWESEAGEGLWMSLLLHPKEPMLVWPRLTTIAALALTRAIEASTPLDLRIKWPNDVLCSEKKIAGILAETATHPVTGPFIVLGIGLNVNQTAFPGPLAETAASLRMCCGSPLDRSALAADILMHLRDLMPLMESDFSTVLEQVKKRSCILGKNVTAEAGGVLVTGVAEDLDGEGCLVLRLHDGSLRKVSAGEVSLRR